ncbi:hypothetical protein Pisl_1787 [Pyrobaculum islandicum DSM 4184]|uniref:Uncharacterized protein n=1 Tax=Pyrobaculum islandicum (strain DSM 4184 / JCM 9189 / GEO3) TaxID=384616 RepID=A1RVF4_PYRIL|nr:ATP-binding protein [Pyrobaculum islandicum]ABL88936.1 hypothetical protein Pisl_1787 [Pyrobaculum islandicum DSM 4184]
MAYVADNVIELIYEVYPYGAVREAVVRKIRGGRAGFIVPYVIKEGVGVLIITPTEPVATRIERLETGTCLDVAAGGLYKGLLHVLVGPPGAGKTWLMLKAVKSLRERGVKAEYINRGGFVYVQQFGVESIDVNLDLGELYAALATVKADVVFIRGLEALFRLYGEQLLYSTLQTLLRVARSGPAVVISLRDLHDLDVLFDVIVNVENRTVTSVRAPGGKIGEKVKC